MENQRTRIWVLIEDIAEIDLTKKAWFYCVHNSIFAYLINTRDPNVREVSLSDGQRGITLHENITNDKLWPFLHRYGIPKDASWWSFPNDTWQFQDEFVEWQRQRGIGVKRPQYIYFILNESRNTLKIGTSIEPESRLRYLQTSCADPLTLLGSMLGSREDERRLHTQFASCQQSGEWFDYNEELQEAIENILNL